MKSGLLLVDKPTGMTSHDVVDSVRRITSQREVGHSGTLDPLATGLMVMLLGDATKLSDFILNGDKAYLVELELGRKSETGDSDGQVIEEKPVTCDREAVQAAVHSLQGEFLWPVPMYSATKVKGKKLYEHARDKNPDKTAVEAPKKTMIFHEVRLVSMELPRLQVHLSCSKGSFVRTWVEQLGEKLGCGAMVTSLRRTASLPYTLDRAIALDKYNPAEAAIETGSHWVPLVSALPGWPSHKVDGMDEKLIKNGQIPHKISRYLEIEFGEHGGVKILSRRSHQLLAILSKESKGFVIKRVFNS